MTKWLVSTDWLADHLNAPDVVIMDASWHLPSEDKNPKTEYLEEHIPDALFFCIDEFSDKNSSLPHMLPDPAKFSSRMRRMGVGDGNRLVVYDTLGLFSAARVWWMFRVFGHDDVAILNGGLPKWKAEGRPLDFDEPRLRQERHFSARLQTNMLCDKDDISNISKSGSRQIVDARAATRFSGEEPEPRPGLRSGHIPGSLNVPYKRLLREDGTVKAPEEIGTVFAKAGIDTECPVTTSCGSGVTAAILALGLEMTGHMDINLYDGSWAEWGSDESLPIETGPVK